MREASILVTPVSSTLYVSLPEEFTVVRFLAWASVTQTDTAAGLLANPPAGVIGVRVASKEEIEEMQANTAYRAESGPVQDPLADWYLYGPVFPASGVGVEGTAEAFVGKESFDIRSARRVDGASEDMIIMLQFPVGLVATATQTMRMNWAALCVT